MENAMFKGSGIATFHQRRDEWDLCFDPMRPVREFMLILGLLLVLFGL